MKLRPDEITRVLREQIEQYRGEIDVEEISDVKVLYTIFEGRETYRAAAQ